jgi:hypothetical protein
MSYPYPFEVFGGERLNIQLPAGHPGLGVRVTPLWGSFAVTKPKKGEIIEAPDGSYRVIMVREGTHYSTGLWVTEGPDVSDKGWFWYGPRIGAL